MPLPEDSIKLETMSIGSEVEVMSPKIEEVSIPASPQSYIESETMSNVDLSERFNTYTHSSVPKIKEIIQFNNGIANRIIYSNKSHPSSSTSLTEIEIVDRPSKRRLSTHLPQSPLIIEEAALVTKIAGAAFNNNNNNNLTEHIIPNKKQRTDNDEEISIIYEKKSKENAVNEDGNISSERKKTVRNINVIEDGLLTRAQKTIQSSRDTLIDSTPTSIVNRIIRKNVEQIIYSTRINNGNLQFDEFLSNLNLDNIKNKRKELRQLKNQYRIKANKKLKREMNLLQSDIERSNNIRNRICEIECTRIYGTLTCKHCEKRKCYEKPGLFINHVINNHHEILKKYYLKEEDYDNASTVCNSADDASSITSETHSISSQRTICLKAQAPAKKLPTNVPRGPNISSIGSRIQNISKGQDYAIPSTSRGFQTSTLNMRKKISSKRSETIPFNTTVRNSLVLNEQILNTSEINFAPRKPITLLENQSFGMHVIYDRQIRLWLKNRNIREKNLNFNKKSNSAQNKTIGFDNFAMNVLYTKEELSLISHCFKSNKTSIPLCGNCQLKLVKHQATQYARSSKAFTEYQKILKNKILDKREKRNVLNELLKQDEYKLIRNRLVKIRDERKNFQLLPVAVEYNKKYFSFLQKAFNHRKIQEYVQFNNASSKKLSFGVYCSKLMDDIVNEFLLQVTVTCMNFAHHDHKVMLTKDLLYRYKLLFKTTNRDATYLEHHPTDLNSILKKEFCMYLPNPKSLEVLIIDYLLRSTFNDGNTMHEDLDTLIFKHLKSPQPIFKFLSYMKFHKDYFEEIKDLLLKFIFQLSVEVLKLKKKNETEETSNLIKYNELIEACEIVGVFNSSYIYYLKNAYKQLEEKILHDFQKGRND